MRLKIYSFYSPDVDLDTYVPVDPTDGGLLIQMLTGPEDREGGESFDVFVCTPAWLARRTSEGPIIGRHHLIVGEINIPAITKYLRELVQAYDEPTWDALAEKVGRIGMWEFEDYQERS